jgi:hypothetical protein
MEGKEGGIAPADALTACCVPSTVQMLKTTKCQLQGNQKEQAR